MKKLKKILSRLGRMIIFLFDGINTNIYMKLYNKWLLKNQLDMKGPAKYIHHSVCLGSVDYKLMHFGENIVISRNVLLLTHDFSIEAGFISIGKSIKNIMDEFFYRFSFHIIVLIILYLPSFIEIL